MQQIHPHIVGLARVTRVAQLLLALWLRVCELGVSSRRVQRLSLDQMLAQIALVAEVGQEEHERPAIRHLFTVEELGNTLVDWLVRRIEFFDPGVRLLSLRRLPERSPAYTRSRRTPDTTARGPLKARSACWPPDTSGLSRSPCKCGVPGSCASGDFDDCDNKHGDLLAGFPASKDLVCERVPVRAQPITCWRHP